MSDAAAAPSPISPLDPVPVLTAVLPRHRDRRFQGIPGIERSRGGRLWATWYAGGAYEGPENFVLVATSDDDGLTWSTPVAVVDPPGAVRAYDPVLWIDPLHRLWLVWAQCLSQRDGNINDGAAGVWVSILADPEDGAAGTWSAPRRIANGVMMNKPTVLADGAWAFPTAVWNDLGGGRTPPELLGERFSNLLVSTDHGATFTRRGGADVPRRAFDEHMTVELADQRLWMLVRTNYGIGQSFSRDGGATWTPGEDSGLPGPDSRFHLRRLASGSLLLISHPRDPAKPHRRWRLTAWLSDDDGRTWSGGLENGGLELDGRDGVSYPDAVQDASGAIWVIHDHQRQQRGDILLSRIREADIRAGLLVSPDAFLYRLVDHSGGVRP